MSAMKASGKLAWERALRALVFVGIRDVGVVVYETSPDHGVRFLYSQRKRFSRHEKETERRHFSVVAAHIDQLFHGVAAWLSKNGAVSADLRHAAFFYEPPLSSVGTERIVLTSEKRAKLDESALRDAVAAAEEKFCGPAGNEPGETGHAAKRVIIARRFIGAKLDGYPVNSYLGRTYREFAASLTLGALPEILTGMAEDAAHSIFPSLAVEHGIVALALFDVLAAFDGIPPSFDYCAILPDQTLIGSVQKGVLMRSASFGGGSRHLLDVVSHSLSVTRSVAESSLSLYEQKRLHGESETHVAAAIATARDAWVAAFADAQQEMSSGLLLPLNTYLVPSGPVDAAVLKEAANTLAVSSQSLEYPVMTPGQFVRFEQSDTEAWDSVAALLARWVLK